MQGTVIDVYSPSNHGIVIVDFDKDYHSTITAVALPQSYAKLPDLSALTGKLVLITGRVSDYHSRPQIVLSRADQIELVK
jgi:DNA/RNA endonuclease YhcR with UshA esterase domain